MTDAERLDWIAENHASLWHDKFGWTVFARRPGKAPVQPTKPKLRDAIDEAIAQVSSEK